ncbi:MAG: RIP metalloprotease RseP [Bacteroidales bacterium]
MLFTLVAFVFMLGVLIFVHELGHYMMAKRLGIRVLTFSLGFGPRIVGFRRGDTEYCISAIPLGGYVKMAGETPDEPRTGARDEFLSRSKWERFQVLIMGPVMNLVLALVLTTVVLVNGAEVPAYENQPPVVAAVSAGSSAEKAGIQPGDRILAVAGQAVSDWEDVFLKVGTRPNRDIAVTVSRDGRTLHLWAKPSSENGTMGELGALPKVHPQVAQVQPGSPAERAGLKHRDVVLAVNGEQIWTMPQLIKAISRHPNEAITLALRRDGRAMEVHATPGADGMIGIAIGDETRIIQPGFTGAIKLSVEKNIEFAGLIYQTVGGLLTRETSPKQLMGPVAIAQMSGRYAELGLFPYLLLMASISLNLGLLNLLPIPVLDGGHIFIMAIEGVARRDFSMKVKEKMLLGGFVLLMALMVTVIYNDLTRIQWISRLMFWR